jgi:CRP/FNR family transcriptional regulator
MTFTGTAPLASDKQSCHNCITKKYCLAKEVSAAEQPALQAYMGRHRILKKGEFLFYQGEKPQFLAIVRSGSVKTYYLTDDGDCQITGFHYPGQLLGADSFGGGVQVVCAEAMETTSICEMACDDFDKLCESLPSFRHEYYRCMGRELARDKKQLWVLGKLHADQRLADFILEIASLKKTQGQTCHEFSLSMAKTDIANYLGVTIETISRLFSRFQAEGLIDTNNRFVKIVNFAGLQTVVRGCCEKLPLAKIA